MVISIQEFEVLVDSEFDYLQYVKWSIRRQYNRQFYFTNKDYGKLHRYIMDCPENMVVDHINGNTLDNRRSNLRICTKLQNQYNQKKHKGKRHSKYKGVTFRKDLKSKPWEAFIYPNRKHIRLGYFKNEKDAAIAYNKAAKKYYGDYAKLNEVE